MSKSQELYEGMKKEWDVFEENQKIFNEKGNMSAAGRARKAIGNIRNAVTDYRKATLEESTGKAKADPAPAPAPAAEPPANG